MNNHIYFIVNYSIRDGDTEYGCNMVVKIINGSYLQRDDIEKMLVKFLYQQEFGDDEEDIEIDTDNPRIVWECGHERYAKLEDFDRIPQNHFKILKKYISNGELTVKEKELVVFS